MNRSDFIPGAAIAFMLAFAASLFIAAPLSWFSPSDTLRLLIPALSGLYLAWLLAQLGSNIGKATAALTWTVTAAGSWFFVDDLTLCGFVHVALVGLVRAFLFRRGPLAAIGELLLSASAGLVAAVALTRTGSVFLSVWSFFLLQAASAFIPDLRGRSTSRARDQSNPAFLRAKLQAEAALERIIER